MKKTDQTLLENLPLHGGDIQAAAARYGITMSDWLDLSTGINPMAYPVQGLPENVFQALPYLQSSFTEAVCRYYRQADFLAVCGTQTAIQALPALLNHGERLPVLLPSVGYKEHEAHWQKAGNACRPYPSLNSDEMCAQITASITQNPQQYLVVINPNNPTGVQVEAAQLLNWAEALAQGAYLIVDEAFIDVTTQKSLLMQNDLPDNVIVLRSFGKFFGLAGLRVGFVFASQALLQALKQTLGLWQINGPAQWLVTQALNDQTWQSDAVNALLDNAQHTRDAFQWLVDQLPVSHVFQTPYFTSYQLPLIQAMQVNTALAEQGILTRLVVVNHKTGLLRIGTFSRQDLVASQRIRDAQRIISMLERK